MYIKRIEGKTDSCKELLLSGPCAVALGTFDGLHRGHMELVRKASIFADEISVKSCIFTFTGNTENAPYITSNEHRIKLMQSEKIDLFIMQEFTEKFKALAPEEFFKCYIVDMLRAKYVIAGFNYHFGHMGAGDEKLLRVLCRKYGIALHIVPPVLYMNEPISSTRIREAVEKGSLTKAKNMLGRCFAVMGDVMRGDGIGRQLGFPTANLEVDVRHVMPPKGVYATLTEAGGRLYPSITNYGGRPTIKKGIDLIETHILNFSEDIYGETIEVRFVKRLRGIVPFSTREELSARLFADKELAEKLLDKNNSLC